MKKILLLLSYCLFSSCVFADQCPSGSEVTVTSLFPLKVIAPVGWKVKKVETISSDFSDRKPADVSVSFNNVQTGYVKNLDRSNSISLDHCGYALNDERDPQHPKILYERGYLSNPFHTPVYYDLIQLIPITMPTLSVGFFSDHLGDIWPNSKGDYVYYGWALETTSSKEYFYSCRPHSTFTQCNWQTSTDYSLPTGNNPFGSEQTHSIREMQNVIEMHLEAVCPENDTKLTAPITTLTFVDNVNNSLNKFIANSNEYIDDSITLKHPCDEKLISSTVHNICKKYFSEEYYIHLPDLYNYDAIPVMMGPSKIQMLSAKSFNCDGTPGIY